MTTPKFGVSYVLFDGEELLESSLRRIRQFVDYINIVYSPKSYYGFDGNPEIPKLLKELKNKKLINEVIFFEAKPISIPEERTKLELKKRNLGLELAKKNNVNFFMTMDTDEFYDSSTFEKAKNKIITKGITHSYVHILNYGKQPTQRYDKWKWEYFVPFFAKINDDSFLTDNNKTPCLTDPTRQISDCKNSKYYVLEDIFIHHMTRVRKNVDSKYKTRKVSSDIDKEWINDLEGFIEVPNYFNIKI